MKSIETHFLGPTDRRGSRLVASDGESNRITIPYPGELDTEAAHTKAAEALKAKMGWGGDLLCGSTRTGYSFVFVTNRIAGALDALEVLRLIIENGEHRFNENNGWYPTLVVNLYERGKAALDRARA